MKNQLYLLAIVSAFLITSCKKDNTDPVDNTGTGSETEEFQTIEPLSYFPAFPGSFWKYVDINGDTTMTSTALEYMEDYYTVGMQGFVSDTFLVPFYQGDAIWRYEAHTGPISNGGSYPFTLLVSDTLPVGSSWINSQWNGYTIRRRILEKDATVTISGQDYYPTIVVEEYWDSQPFPGVRINRRYFTKDIGIVREDTYNPSDTLVNTKYLIEYDIND